MTPSKWADVRRHFEAALDLDPAARDESVDSIADPEVREEVRRLLTELSLASSFMETPAASAGRFESLLGGRQILRLHEVLLDRFEILDLIGSGGMGEVYAAEDRHLAERVAIKTIRAAMRSDPRHIEMFRREVRRTRQVSHPNVCRIHELFQIDGEQPLLFFTMELLDGTALSRRLREQGPLPPGEALAAAGQLAAGLAAAHGGGLVHGDLKPGNVILTKTGRAVLTDFGLSAEAVRGEPGDPSGPITGTLRYMAPEQLTGSRATTASDVYALGLVLYEMSTGQLPLDSSQPLFAANRRATEPLPPPSSVEAALPPAWDRVVLACLERQPGQRPSAQKLAEMLSGRWKARPRVPLPGRRQALAGGLALAAGAAGWLGYRTWRAPAAAAPNPWLILAELEGPPSDPDLVSALRYALTSGLEESGQIRIFPARRIAPALELMGVPRTTPLTAELARRVAAREGVRRLGTGGARLTADGVTFFFTVVDPATQATLVSAAEPSAPGESLTEALDRLVRTARRQLGEAEQSVDAAPSLARVSTPSFEALARFSSALRYYEQGRNAQALTLLESAVKLDPEFAMGYEYQALIYASGGEEGRGFPLAERAWQLRGRTVERERLQIEALYAVLQGDYERGLDGYRALAALYPDDPRILRHLAHHYAMTGRLTEAVRTAESAAQVDPQPVPQTMLPIVLAQAGRLPEARQAVARAAERGVDSRLLAWPEGLIALVDGDAAAAGERFRYWGTADGWRSAARLFGAGALILEGRLAEAAEEAESALPAALERREALYVVQFRKLAAQLHGRLGAPARALPHLRALLEAAPEPWNLDELRFAAHLAVELGQAPAARAAAQRLAEIARQHPSTRSSGLAAEARGLAAFLDGRRTEARAALREAHSLWNDALSQWALGRFLADCGDTAGALAPLTALTSGAGSALRWLVFVPWVHAQLTLARCLQAAGRREEARRAYDRFLHHWRAAAPASPLVRDAVAEYSRHFAQ